MAKKTPVPNKRFWKARTRLNLSRAQLAADANGEAVMRTCSHVALTENYIGMIEQGRVGGGMCEKRISALCARLKVADPADIGLVAERRLPTRSAPTHRRRQPISVPTMAAKIHSCQRDALPHPPRGLFGALDRAGAEDARDRAQAKANHQVFPDSTSSTTDRPLIGGELAAGASLELPASGLIAIRAALDTADLPPDGPLRPVADLTADVAEVTRLRLASNYKRLCAVLPDLLDDLHRAYSSWQGQRRVAVAALLAQTYRAADALADKSGRYDLSARIIGMMIDAARQSGNEVLLATTSYVRGELFFANGRPDLGRTLLERAAERLDPDTDVASSAAYGSLHMRAGVLAGQARQLDYAHDHLAVAAQWAARVADGEYNGTAFGPSSVRIHKVTLAVDTNDPDTALRVSCDWDPSDKLSAERRSHFYIDVARAQAQLDKANAAVIALFQARAVAPEHTRFHPHVHEVVTRLLDKRAVTSQVVEFARWARISTGLS